MRPGARAVIASPRYVGGGVQRAPRSADRSPEADLRELLILDELVATLELARIRVEELRRERGDQVERILNLGS